MHLVQYPIRREELFNQAAAFKSNRLPDETDQWGTKEELNERFSMGCEHVKNALKLLQTNFRWPDYDHKSLSKWSHDRLALLDEAVHPTLQYAAQGAAQALEDACALASSYKKHGPSKLHAVFHEYEQERIPRSTKIVHFAREIGIFAHYDGMAKIVRDTILRDICDTTQYVCDKNTVPCGCGQTNVDINARIINGENALEGSWSMMVTLRDNTIQSDSDRPEHFCGGTILSESYILTAAHCFKDVPENSSLEHFSVAAGILNQSQSNPIIRQIDKIIIHPFYRKGLGYNRHDIAILHLTKPLDLGRNSSITRTCLPPRSDSIEEMMQYPPNGTNLVAIGWGSLTAYGGIIYPDTLQQLTIPLVHQADRSCFQSISDPAVQFCAGLHKDGICSADSGGPIFQWIGDRWQQVGIASYVQGGCLFESGQAVFTRISYFNDWINLHISENNQTLISNNNTEVSRVQYHCNGFQDNCGCGYAQVVLSPSILSKSESALPYSWSMVVSIRTGINNQHICSGTILEEYYILTAAHCLRNRLAQDITIATRMYYRSESSALIRQVDQIYIHPNYTENSNQYMNDIAILRLSQSLRIVNDQLVSRTCIPTIDDEWIDVSQYASNGSQLVVTGWNIINTSNISKSEILQQAEIFVVDDSETSNCYVSDDQRQNQFCAGRYGNDKGDSGSPVFQRENMRWTQVGLTSYCRTSSGHGVFTRLTAYVDWIKSILSSIVIKPAKTYQCDKKAPCGCGQTDVVLTSSRTVGGENTVGYSWPMMVSFEYYDRLHECGGTILSDSWILSAAGCFFRLQTVVNMTIFAGIHNLSQTVKIKRNTDRIYMHPNYSLGYAPLHDIALVHLDQPLPLDNVNMSAIFAKTCVPNENELSSDQYSDLVIVGWGTSRFSASISNTLQQLSVRMVDNNDKFCSSTIKNSSYQFCAGFVNDSRGADINLYCRGQSGGPVFMYKNNHWEQVSPTKGYKISFAIK
ncbi:unnamed protein product [Rotaria sp. Silwood1]|nr:unnamed protein product [Rotaria sp. Silwood1]